MDGVISADHSHTVQRRIPLETDWINAFLSISLSKEEMKAILRRSAAPLTATTSSSPPSGPTLSTRRTSPRDRPLLRLQQHPFHRHPRRRAGQIQRLAEVRPSDCKHHTRRGRQRGHDLFLHQPEILRQNPHARRSSPAPLGGHLQSAGRGYQYHAHRGAALHAGGARAQLQQPQCERPSL